VQLFVQFAKGDEVFLMQKHFCATRAIVCGFPGKDLFHGAYLTNDLYKLEVDAMMLPDAPLPFPNYKDEYVQLCLKQVQGQFTLWESALM
jgi:hypothetical protein